MNYCKKPINEREKIIFSNNYNLLNDACKNKRTVIFSVIWDEKHLHEVTPYAVVSGKEEMFNYLICEEYNPYKSINEVRSYRLNRITNLRYGHTIGNISNENQQLCDLTIEYSPQYAINTCAEICVRLSDDGEKIYNRIYFGRPQYIKIIDDAPYHYYYFNCSPIQVFHYFRKFDNNTAIVISPIELQEKIITFHKNSLDYYQKLKEEKSNV